MLAASVVLLVLPTDPARADALPPQLALVAGARQALIVTAVSTATTSASIEGWQRDTAGTWSRFLAPQPAVVGQAGLVNGPDRVQGDRRTPMGVFPVAEAFGIDASPDTRVPYTVLDADDYWAGDQRDPETYNLFQTSHPGSARWSTAEAERLAAETVAYRTAINIGFNLPGGVYTAGDGQRMAAQPADTRIGNAIFLHAFGVTGPTGYTAGCVAMDLGQLRFVLQVLDPALAPTIVIGTTMVPPTPQDRKYVGALYLDLLGRPVDPSGSDTWSTLLSNGRLSRYALALELARSQEYLGSVVTDLYTGVLGRAPDPVGLAGWVAVLRSGGSVASVGAAFYASDEAFARAGGSPADSGPWVDVLYRRLLGREADPAGRQGWVAAVATSGRFAVASAFYASQETLRRRVQTLYVRLLGRDADPVGLAGWPSVVASQGDLALAASLASSAEYYDRAQRR